MTSIVRNREFADGTALLDRCLDSRESRHLHDESWEQQYNASSWHSYSMLGPLVSTMVYKEQY